MSRSRDEAAGWVGLRAALLLTLVVALPIVLALPPFFSWLGDRPGALPPEPLLPLLPSMDLSRPLFMLLYGGIALGLLRLYRHPARFVRGLQAYLLLLLLRMASMALFTLEPPPDMVLLNDPVIQHFYPGKEPFTKDLFFSGHVATACLLAFAMPEPSTRLMLLVMAGLVAIAVLIQHVHWTIDVLAAPVFAWLAWQGGAVTLRATRAAGGMAGETSHT